MFIWETGAPGSNYVKPIRKYFDKVWSYKFKLNELEKLSGFEVHALAALLAPQSGAHWQALASIPEQQRAACGRTPRR